MEVVNHKIPILIVGATGMLGSAITEVALLNPNLRVNILVRDPSEAQDLASRVEAAGGKVIVGDLAKPETIKDATKGVHTVVSAVRESDEKISVDGQKALVEDAIRNGVKRFVPSEYGLDYSKFSKDELSISEEHRWKTKFNEYLYTVNIPTLKFFVGIFMHTFLEVLQKTQCYYGEPDLHHNMTTVENTARLVVAGVGTAALTGNIYYSGGDYTVREIQDIYNKFRDTNVEIRRVGYIGDLRNEYEEAKKSEGENSERVKLLGLLLVLYDKRSKFSTLDDDTFPDVRPTSFEDFLDMYPEASLEKSQ